MDDDDTLTSQLDELTDRIDSDGNGWSGGDYALLLDISDFLHSLPEQP